MAQDLLFLTGTIRAERATLLLMAEAFSKRGYNVTVIAGYPNLNVSQEYRQYQLDNPDERRSPTLRILRVGTKKWEPNSLLVRAWRGVKLSKDIYRAAKKIGAETCIIYSTPPALGVTGAKLAKKDGVKTLFLAQDLFPDTLFSLHGFLEKTIIGKILRKREQKVYRDNTHTVTISHAMKEHMVSLGAEEEKISVLYNWANTEDLNHVAREDNRLFDEYGIDRKKFIVSFAGNLGMLQDVEILLDVAKILKEQTDIQFVIFGKGVRESTIRERIQNEKIENVSLFPIQSPERVSEVYSLGDLEFVCVREGVMSVACPHKTFDIFAVGSPILAMIDEGCDIAKKIREDQLGYVVPQDAQAIADAVLQAYQNRDSLAQMGENGRTFAESISFQKQLDRYEQIVKKL